MYAKMQGVGKMKFASTTVNQGMKELKNYLEVDAQNA